MQPATTKANYFPSLTGIRTVASCMVFLHHFNPFKAEWFGTYLHDFVGEFHVGVTIFFVLSGFLICHRYYDDAASPVRSIRPYLVNRLARIYPMYFIITTLSFVPAICHCLLQENTGILLLNLTFLRGFFDEYKFTGVPGGWSLTVEEMFYFLFPAIILASGKIRLRYQPAILLGIGVLLWLVFRNISFHGFFSSARFLFEFTFFGRCVEFFAGMWLALAFRAEGEPVLARKNYKMTGWGMACIILIISLLVVNRWHSAEGSAQFVFFETLLNNFLLPAAIVLLLRGLLTENTLLNRLLSSSPFVLLGKSSYVFYLIHNGFLFSFLYLTLNLNLPVIFVVLQGIAIILFFLVENPLNKLIRKLA